MTTLSLAQTRALEISIGVSDRLPRTAEGGTVPIPETVVLERWRRLGSRRQDGSTYHGCRLPPSLWWLVAAALEAEPGLLALPPDAVARVLATVRASRREAGRFLGSLPATALLALLRFLRRTRRLDAILAAHAGEERAGVTDLLLYRLRKGRHIDFRFVEVKRPTERVREDQRLELELLRGLGLTVGIFRFRASSPGAPALRTPRTRRPRGPQRPQDVPDESAELSAEMLALIDASVDEEMERWARSLILANGTEVRKLTEEEVQLAVGKRASPRK